MARPLSTDHAPYFGRYISLVDAENVAGAISNYSAALLAFYENLPEEKADYRYADNKWTLKEVLQHVMDTERIFTYRVLRISRNDSTPNPSFDENSFAENAEASARTFASLKEEFSALRRSTDLFLASLQEHQLTYAGISSDHRTTANALAFMIFGHMLHHKQILEERYL